eukprot:g26715.t1
MIVAVPTIASAQVATIPKPADISKESTHEQVSLIKATEGARSLKLNTFCIDKKGNILAGCNAGFGTSGSGKGVVRVFNGDGKLLRSWNVPVNAEAINVAPDGTVLVAGNGKLLRYNTEGKQIHEAAAPHYAHLKSGGDELRKQVILQFKSRASNYDRIIKAYTDRLETYKKKKELTATEKRLQQAYQRSLESIKRARAQLSKTPEPSKEDIDRQVAMMIQMKTGISSISSDGKYVYIATRALKGYGFAIWRTDTKFKNAKQIVENLRGCCGQMDVQANAGGVYTIAIIGVIFVAFLTRATFGFGDALVGMPFLIMLAGKDTATPLLALISLTIAAIVLFQDYRSVRFRQAGMLVLASMIGIVIGLTLFNHLDEHVVLGALGAVLILFSAYSLLKPELPRLETDRAVPLVGVVAGILHGAYNAPGPPLVVYGAMRRWPPEQFRATLQAYFLPTSLAVVIGHGVGRRLTPEVWTLFLYTLLVIPVCAVAGRRINARFRTESFAAYLHIALIVIGVSLVVNATFI